MKPYYEDSAVTIYHGDCRLILPQLPKVDLVLTDPPYELTATGGGLGKKRGYAESLAGLTDGFDMDILSPFESWMCFCSKDQLIDLLTLAAKGGRWMLLTWNKPDPTPLMNCNYLPDTEYIVHRFQRLYGGYESRARFIVMPGGAKDYHPTGKPLNLIRRLLQVGSDNGSLILDPFMGSGTTLVAAQSLGRKSIGIEIEEKYCKIAVERLRQKPLDLTMPMSHDRLRVEEKQGGLFDGSHSDRRNEAQNIGSEQREVEDGGSETKTKGNSQAVISGREVINPMERH